MGLHTFRAHELRPRLQAGELGAEELTRAVLDHLGATQPAINAFISIDHEGALAQARAVDQRRARGEPLGALAGIPVALKDLICVRGGRTTCGSRILEDFVAPYDATVVEKLRAADAVLIGKTNMDEFAMGSSTENSHFGPTRNPRAPDRVPGGSSGGSAAAVAADQTILALGSDTGGSVRQPAGYCGVVGLKPTYGRVSRYGLVAYASSLDQIGPLTKDVRDAALLLGVVAGHDPRDATSVDQPVPDYEAVLSQGVKRLKVGLAREHFGPGLDGQIRRAVEAAAGRLEKEGAELVEVSLPVAGHADYCIGAYYLIAMTEASANLARYDGVRYGFRAEGTRGLQELYHQTRSQGFGEEVKRRIMLGTYALSAGYYDAYYLKAQQVRTLIRRDFARAFAACDLLLSPVAPTTAFRLGEQLEDPLQMYLNDIYTVSVNLAGLPGISVPAGCAADGLPIGAQLLAAPLQEENLLRAARVLEQTTPPT
ncbi:MAG: Asp-tRNA(Asn)/Glu-tRNA(Gln) amidotransferase subunit GatA [Candidatus Latescibacteria bacterium]|nr:Asp-tRNA(Asn)/Glu-tRNA(Gln) amidotransferase subunit GatA [Candidatus Latescibacterota bacterium]